MEHWELQVNVTIVTNTVSQGLLTGLTHCILLAHSLGGRGIVMVHWETDTIQELLSCMH